MYVVDASVCMHAGLVPLDLTGLAIKMFQISNNRANDVQRRRKKKEEEEVVESA
jgi:hypothetical protein